MTEPRDFTVGATAQRREAVACDACGSGWEVTLRATGSVTAEATGRDDPALLARAQKAAEENLARMAPMESCPRCGRYPETMVQRMFRDGAYAALKRRHDDVYAAVNAPWARARRLRAHGLRLAELAEVLSAEVEAQPRLHDLLSDLDRDPALGAGSAGGRGSAGDTEAEILAHHLHARRRLPTIEIEEALVHLGGLDPRRAEQVTERLARDKADRERSLGFVLAGAGVLIVGGMLAAFVTFVLPVLLRVAATLPATTSRTPEPIPQIPTRTATARDDVLGLTAHVDLPHGGSPQFRLVVDARHSGSRFGHVILGGVALPGADLRGTGGIPTIAMDTSAYPALFPPGQESRIELFAEVFDRADPETFQESARTVRGAFTVRIPAPGEVPGSDETLVSVAGKAEDHTAERVAAALGHEGIAGIDRTLFGEPRKSIPAAGTELSEMDRDIRRAELKERAHLLAAALTSGALAESSAFVAPEDRSFWSSRLAWLAEERLEPFNARIDEVNVDPSGTTGEVRSTVSVDHAEGMVLREGRAPWSFRDGMWLYDPVP